MFVWLAFLICVILTFAAGVQLCRYGDIIADKTGGWASIVLFVVYVLNSYVLYLYGVE